ncbi:MAG: hypothetical protein ACJ8F7_09595 [Gemmataceae bacterium]
MKLESALVLLVMAALAVGCGSEGGPVRSTATDPLAGYPKGPTREFIVPGGDNAMPEYGREAAAMERKQASALIQRWMRARAARDFVDECRYFSRRFIRHFVTGDAEVVSEGRVKTCPQALAYFGSDASGDFKNTLTGPIDSLRVAKGLGFAQYHGKGGIDWEIPVNKEDGTWRVAKAAPVNEEG